MEPKHTPTPLRIVPVAVDEPGPGEDGTIYEYHIREGMVTVLRTYDLEVAERVVRAVNCHEELLGIVKEWFGKLKAEDIHAFNISLVKRTEQAIAKAEGK